MKALPAAAELLTLSAIELSHRLQSREVKAVDLMKTTLERIDEVNPKVNAIIALRKGKPIQLLILAPDPIYIDKYICGCSSRYIAVRLLAISCCSSYYYISIT